MDLPAPVNSLGLPGRTGRARPPASRAVSGGRLVALLGGTTSLGDCLAAASFLVRPHRLISGPALRRYELAFAEYIGVRHGYSFSSGRVALFGILQALQVGAGDDVILQAPTHVVVANSIRYTGARPVFADSTLGTCNMDVTSLDRCLTSRTRAIVLQHTFGVPADLDVVLRIADRRGIPVIEDCVHALGARYHGARVGSLGRAAFFSTEETKTISTTMGGMAVTDDADLARRLHSFQQQCALPPPWLTVRYLAKLISYQLLTQPRLHTYTRALYEALGHRNPLPSATSPTESLGGRPAGYERRLSNAQALIGLRQLQRIEQNLARREWIAAACRNSLREVGFDVPDPPAGASPAYLRVPVLVADRQAAMAAVAPHAVLGTWFTSVLEEATDPGACGYQAGSCPAAELLSRHLVNLPTHQRVSVDDVSAIVAALAATPGQTPLPNRSEGAGRPA